MEDKRDAPLRQSLAKSGALAVTQTEVDDGRGQVRMASQTQPIVKIVGTENRCAGFLETLDDVECDQGLVLDDEDRAAGKRLFPHVPPQLTWRSVADRLLAHSKMLVLITTLDEESASAKARAATV